MSMHGLKFEVIDAVELGAVEPKQMVQMRPTVLLWMGKKAQELTAARLMLPFGDFATIAKLGFEGIDGGGAAPRMSICEARMITYNSNKYLFENNC